jgi:hypothetical protein
MESADIAHFHFTLGTSEKIGPHVESAVVASLMASFSSHPAMTVAYLAASKLLHLALYNDGITSLVTSSALGGLEQ